MFFFTPVMAVVGIYVLAAILPAAGDIRRTGSACMDLCDVACGRSEAYFEWILQPWDYAAASLIIEEAGGIITTVEGEPLSFVKPCSVLARNRD